MLNLTPKEIVAELDKHIIGQNNAKKAVAIALRNRYRRKQLPSELSEEIYPKNIIMIGSTGVGKTEIARRLAKLVQAPFVKVEASKFTEVGYVGRDVDSMVRDLVETAIRIVKKEKMEEVEEKAKILAEERIANFLIPAPRRKSKSIKNPLELFFANEENEVRDEELEAKHYEIEQQREIVKQKLKRMELEDAIVEIEVEEKNTSFMEVFTGTGVEEMGINFNDMLGNLVPKSIKKRKVTVEEARKILTNEEAQNLIDIDEVYRIALKRAEEDGIIFLDEIDKIASKEGGSGPDVSRGGVQRDILPIVEGATVITKYGPVKTDHMLFIAAGAFHMSQPSDLIPELQGRFPIRVELDSLTKDDLKRILTEPRNALTKQYIALISTENVQIVFADDAIDYIAKMAFEVNNKAENIGARRLYTVMEKVLEDLLYSSPEMSGEKITIDKSYVETKLKKIVEDDDLSRYIL